jgi:hypothetical protein
MSVLSEIKKNISGPEEHTIIETDENSGPDRTEADTTPDVREGNDIEGYIARAYEDFLEAGRRLEESRKKEEIQIDKSFREKEKQLFLQYQQSLSGALESHKRTIVDSIKTYEESLRQAAQAFISTKESAEGTYMEMIVKATESLYGEVNNAWTSRNKAIEHCRRAERK